MRTILHLSDLHIGPHHREEVAAGLVNYIKSRQPDLVVISGDLTHQARPGQFERARRFVDDIPVPTVVVPGNHDIPWARLGDRLYRPFEAYRRHFSRTLEPTYQDNELAVVGVNSAHGWTWRAGRVTRRQRDRIASRFASVPSGRTKIVVLHHQLVPPPRFGDQRVLRHARQTVEVLARCGVDIVLAGHFHQAYVASSGAYFPGNQPYFLELHAGTAASSLGRKSDRGENHCYLIEVRGRALRISLKGWNAKERLLETRSTQVFCRQVRQGSAPHDGSGLLRTLRRRWKVIHTGLF